MATELHHNTHPFPSLYPFFMAAQKHTVEVIKTDLEIEEHLELHERGWRTQRVGWFIILALVVLAGLGIFGQGIASKRTVTREGTKVEYERFFRHEAPMKLRVELSNTAGNQPVISFPGQYLKYFKIESIVPESKEVKIEGGQVHYLFDATPPLQVVFYLIPQQIGNIEGTLQTNNHSIPLTHFIYP
jgi:hypothetical protein